MADGNPKIMLPPHWIEKGRQEKYTCRIFSLSEVRFQHPTRKTEADFYLINTKDWVLVIGMTPEREILLVNQFRFGVQANSWEIPGGIIEKGENPLEAGVREMLEETGYNGENARIIASCNPNPALMNNRCHYVFVENIKKTDKVNWDENEEIVVKTVPVSEVLRMADDGEMIHALVITGLFYAQRELARMGEQM